jgi:hypothetical protein
MPRLPELQCSWATSCPGRDIVSWSNFASPLKDPTYDADTSLPARAAMLLLAGLV